MKEIPLTQGLVALVDDEDYDHVSMFKWYAERSGDGMRYYAARSFKDNSGKKTSMKMHRFILGITDKTIDCDHADMNGLNNQKSNLRPCSRSENMRNTRAKRSSSTGIKGIILHKSSGLWMARIRINGAIKYLGYFKNPELAHDAYCNAANSIHGHFARTE